MRVVELSNHPGAMLREIRLRPDADDPRDATALAQHQLLVIGILNDSTAALSKLERMQVERLIIRDHRFHTSKRKS